MTQKYVQVWGTFAATSRMERKRQLSRDITDVQLLMRSICDKWALLLLHQLSLGKKRHGELHRALFGISEKMLTQTLRKLERWPGPNGRFTPWCLRMSTMREPASGAR